MTWFRRVTDILRNALAGFIRHDDMTRAAALAFYTVLSLSPLLIVGLDVISRLYAPGKERYFAQMAELAGPATAQVMNDILANANRHADSGWGNRWIGIVVLLLGATALFSNLHKTMNRIWEVQSPLPVGIANWFRTRGISLVLILVTGVLVLALVLAQTALTIASAYVGAQSPWLQSMTISLFFVALFALIYRIVPDVKVTWRAAISGGIITTVLFVLGRKLIALYLSALWSGAAYGAAGGLFLLLLWTYYSAIVMLFGVEITRAMTADSVPSTPLQNL